MHFTKYTIKKRFLKIVIEFYSKGTNISCFMYNQSISRALFGPVPFTDSEMVSFLNMEAMEARFSDV